MCMVWLSGLYSFPESPTPIIYPGRPCTPPLPMLADVYVCLVGADYGRALASWPRQGVQATQHHGRDHVLAAAVRACVTPPPSHRHTGHMHTHSLFLFSPSANVVMMIRIFGWGLMNSLLTLTTAIGITHAMQHPRPLSPSTPPTPSPYP